MWCPRLAISALLLLAVLGGGGSWIYSAWREEGWLGGLPIIVSSHSVACDSMRWVVRDAGKYS